MTEVKWDEIQHVYEDMVSLLLSRLHPDAERIDGSGGDGGRDVQIRDGDTLHAFELKSFTGRLGNEKGRRAQVKRSLARAAKLNPASWSLVVPINHTDGELEWFDGLRKKYSFPLYWKGRDWLNDRMAKYPDIRRYFLEDGEREALRLLRELNSEQAGLERGAPDAIDRLRVLRERMHEIDPHYDLRITIDGDRTEVTVVPKYRDATRDRPIVGNVLFTFPQAPLGEESEAAFRAVFDYGEEATVPVEHLELDLPAGLGGTFDEGQVTIGPTAERLAFQASGRLQIHTPDGRRLASVPLRFFERRLGQRGGSLKARDFTDSIHLTVRFDHVDRTSQADVGFRPTPGLYPGALLAVLRVGHHWREPNSVHITLEGTDLGTFTQTPDSELVAAETIELIEDLDKIQNATNTPFAVPDELTRSDILNIRQAATLLDGEVVETHVAELSWDIHPNPHGFSPMEDSDEVHQILLRQPDLEVSIGGEQVPLGTAQFHAPAVRLANRDDVLRHKSDWEAGREVHVVYRPEPGTKVTLRLIGPLEAIPGEG